MSDLILYRQYLESATMGELVIPHADSVFTIEQPWRDNRRFESCIPEGRYRMRTWTRPSGAKVWILSNPELNVFELKEDAGDTGRYLCLFHKGNYVNHVQGCIAPGLGTDYKVPAVWRSGKAMIHMRDVLDWYNVSEHELIIKEAEDEKADNESVDDGADS